MRMALVTSLGEGTHGFGDGNHGATGLDGDAKRHLT